MDSDDKNVHARELAALGASKGGRVRAEKMTPERRREIAIAAAEHRWGTAVPVAEYDGTLRIGELEFPCAVLSDGSRVLTETNFMKGMGIYRSGALSVRRGEKDETGTRMPLYLAFKNLRPFIEEHLGAEHARPRYYRNKSGGLVHGIPAEIIPKVCDVWLDARRAGVLGPRQEEIASRAEVLVRGLAHVGIIALVDEATGYQRDRARDALAKILEAFVARELRKWVKTFPADYYEQLFRLRGLKYPPTTVKKPQYIGHLTNDVVYKRLAPGVLEELKRVTPRDDQGRHKHQLHRRLTEDVGHPRLREHVAAVVALMKASDRWEDFTRALDRAFPKYGTTMLLPGIES